MCYLAATLKNFSKEAAAIQLQVLGPRNVNDALPISSNFSDCFDSFLIVACVSFKEFAELYKTESSKAYLVLWTNVSNSSLKNRMEALVRLIIGGNMKSKMVDSVVLPAKYSDYANVFDKHWVDVLFKHSQHDLAIEIEKNQVSLFGLTYDYNKPKLEVLYEYINDMLEKRFIVFSKSLSGALVLFTKKSDGGLYFCINFCGLNAMTKKNKHSLLLIRTLLDLFARAKHYTKVDFIATYNLLHIKQDNK